MTTRIWPLLVLCALTPAFAGCTGIVRDQPLYRIQIDGEGFQPALVSIPAGSVVRWVNTRTGLASVTAQDGGWNSGLLFGGEGYERRFEVPGTYRYYSELQPDRVVGEITVQP